MLGVWWVEEIDEPGAGRSLVLSEGECKKPRLFEGSDTQGHVLALPFIGL